MCAIFGSKNLQEFLELAEINSHRGSFSYSIMGFSKDMNILHLKKHMGVFDNLKAEEVFKDSAYVIGHIQAPTGASTEIHPAHTGSLYLYHNGMIKTQSMSDLPNYRPGIWDTELLLKEILNDSLSLGNIDGSFACVLIDASLKTLKIFTNNTCSLYINKRSMSISSTKQKGFKRITPNTIFGFAPISAELTEIGTFDSDEDIYFIPDGEEADAS